MEEDNVPPPKDEQIIAMPSLSGVFMIAAVVNFWGRADYGLGNAKQLQWGWCPLISDFCLLTPIYACNKQWKIYQYSPVKKTRLHYFYVLLSLVE
jgi:hypothetical protein